MRRLKTKLTLYSLDDDFLKFKFTDNMHLPKEKNS